MKKRKMILLMALTFAGPAHSASLLTNETELHVEARGSIMADFAILKTTLIAWGQGKDACAADVARRLAKIKADLLAAGVPASSLSVGPGVCEQKADGGAPQNFLGFAEAVMVEPPPGSAPDPAEATEGTANSGDDRSKDAAEANAASISADAAAAKARREAERRRHKLPVFAAKMPISVRIDDLAKVPDARAAVGMGPGMIPGRLNNDSTDYRFNKPAEVHGLAYADALARARKEADLLAQTLGAHVVRIARVSNREAPVSLADLTVFIGMMSQSRGGDIPWTIPATHTVSISVDFVISPN